MMYRQSACIDIFRKRLFRKFKTHGYRHCRLNLFFRIPIREINIQGDHAVKNGLCLLFHRCGGLVQFFFIRNSICMQHRCNIPIKSIFRHFNKYFNRLPVMCRFCHISSFRGVFSVFSVFCRVGFTLGIFCLTVTSLSRHRITLLCPNRTILPGLCLRPGSFASVPIRLSPGRGCSSICSIISSFRGSVCHISFSLAALTGRGITGSGRPFCSFRTVGRCLASGYSRPFCSFRTAAGCLSPGSGRLGPVGSGRIRSAAGLGTCPGPVPGHSRRNFTGAFVPDACNCCVFFHRHIRALGLFPGSRLRLSACSRVLLDIRGACGYEKLFTVHYRQHQSQRKQHCQESLRFLPHNAFSPSVRFGYCCLHYLMFILW